MNRMEINPYEILIGNPLTTFRYIERQFVAIDWNLLKSNVNRAKVPGVSVDYDMVNIKQLYKLAKKTYEEASRHLDCPEASNLACGRDEDLVLP